jgi:hypothetical protein
LIAFSHNLAIKCLVGGRRLGLIAWVNKGGDRDVGAVGQVGQVPPAVLKPPPRTTATQTSVSGETCRYSRLCWTWLVFFLCSLKSKSKQFKEWNTLPEHCIAVLRCVGEGEIIQINLYSMLVVAQPAPVNSPRTVRGANDAPTLSAAWALSFGRHCLVGCLLWLAGWTVG